MTETKDPPPPAESFVAALRRFAEQKNRGRLADLRKGLSPSTEHMAWPVLGQLGAFNSKIPLAVWQTVAGLFAAHPEHKAIGNLGVTCRLLRREKKLDADDPMDRRFRRMLACETREDLCGQLPSVVKLAKSQGVPVDYEQLFRDLQWFDFDPKKIKVAWSSRYFGVPEASEKPSEVNA